MFRKVAHRRHKSSPHLAVFFETAEGLPLEAPLPPARPHTFVLTGLKHHSSSRSLRSLLVASPTSQARAKQSLEGKQSVDSRLSAESKIIPSFRPLKTPRIMPVDETVNQTHMSSPSLVDVRTDEVQCASPTTIGEIPDTPSSPLVAANKSSVWSTRSRLSMIRKSKSTLFERAARAEASREAGPSSSPLPKDPSLSAGAEPSKKSFDSSVAPARSVKSVHKETPWIISVQPYQIATSSKATASSSNSPSEGKKSRLSLAIGRTAEPRDSDAEKVDFAIHVLTSTTTGTFARKWQSLLDLDSQLREDLPEIVTAARPSILLLDLSNEARETPVPTTPQGRSKKNVFDVFNRSLSKKGRRQSSRIIESDDPIAKQLSAIASEASLKDVSLPSDEQARAIVYSAVHMSALSMYLTDLASHEAVARHAAWKSFFAPQSEDIITKRKEKGIKRMRSDLAKHLTLRTARSEDDSKSPVSPRSKSGDRAKSARSSDLADLPAPVVLKSEAEPATASEVLSPSQMEDTSDDDQADDSGRLADSVIAPEDAIELSQEVKRMNLEDAQNMQPFPSPEPASNDTPVEPTPSAPRKERKANVDDFDIIRVLGKGCAGKVMLVRKKRTDAVYAMKAIPKHHVLAQRELNHTLTEQRVLRNVADHHDNPFIVKLWWSFHDKENLYLIMDFHPGGDLATQLARWGRLGRDRSRFYACEIAYGLEGLHAAGVIYRDLKPENILIAADGHCVLTDFGLSKQFDSPAEKTEGLPLHRQTTSTFCGTAEYLAPEVLIGVPYSYETDWWSFGTMLFEMLVGTTPFASDDHAAMYKRVLHEELRFPEEGRPMDVDTRSLLRGLLQKDPLLRMSDGRIRKHAYFSMIDWSCVALKRYIPPYTPTVKNATDISNFDEMFTSQEATSIMETASDAFDGYSYRAAPSFLDSDSIAESVSIEAPQDARTRDDSAYAKLTASEPDATAPSSSSSQSTQPTSVEQALASSEAGATLKSKAPVVSASTRPSTSRGASSSAGEEDWDIIENPGKDGMNANAKHSKSMGLVDRYRLRAKGTSAKEIKRKASKFIHQLDSTQLPSQDETPTSSIKSKHTSRFLGLRPKGTRSKSEGKVTRRIPDFALRDQRSINSTERRSAPQSLRTLSSGGRSSTALSENEEACIKN
ncbi:uncharacterized protein L969DRAFT_17769 [Mixia osmundae IAM 14324]|uniref:uncharacterized protein n=1 Tax=Mixia osmundae (strain CBS 9802 / IAM 14324 / JCM 22182 / KY 12970) TaxID=764103 RepID=UPI0004A55656|nr:uncharacterized protein L969DRAFT_17769 [Mixia osmundae IAM 14324]KEI38690.1 hypothetical protein L969DRAFT_17769 [Mixia osmundae IAM 14324]